MPDKKLSQIFSKYTPVNKGQSDIFENAYSIRVRGDKEKRMYEVYFSYPQLLKMKAVYELEENLAEFYDLESVRFYPAFPKELFAVDYMSEIIESAKRTGVAVKGFFNNYSVRENDGVITIEIPFESAAGIILDLAKTEQLISDIIMREFSLNYRVNIVYTQGDDGIESYLASRESAAIVVG